MPERERTVIGYTLGLRDGEMRTQDEAGEFVYNTHTETYGITGSGVRKYVNRGFEMLRRRRRIQQIVKAMEDTSVVPPQIMGQLHQEF